MMMIGTLHGFLDALRSSGWAGHIARAAAGAGVGGAAGAATADTDQGAFGVLKGVTSGMAIGGSAGLLGSLAYQGGSKLLGRATAPDIGVPGGAARIEQKRPRPQSITGRALTGGAADAAQAWIRYPTSWFESAVDWIGTGISQGAESFHGTEVFGKVIAKRAIQWSEGYKSAVLDAHGAGESLWAKDPATRIKRFVKDYMDGVDPGVEAKANAYGDYVTYTSELDSMLSQGAEQLIHKVPGLGLILGPFFRTSVNVMKSALDFTPGLHWLATDTKAALQSSSRAVADEARARFAVGGMLAGAGTLLAATGHITEPDATSTGTRSLQRTEGEGLSLLVGNAAIPLHRFGLAGAYLEASAYLAHEFKNWVLQGDFESDSEMIWTSMQAAGLALTLGISHAIMSDSVLDDWKDALQAVTARTTPDLTTFGNKLFRLPSAVVPASVGQTRRATDPYLREVYTLMDTFRNKIPHLSNNLEPVIDAKGAPAKTGWGEGLNALDPIRITLPENDVVSDRILALGMEFRLPDKAFMFGAKRPGYRADAPEFGLDITPNQGTWLRVLSGNGLKIPADQLQSFMVVNGASAVKIPGMPAGTTHLGMWEVLTALVHNKDFAALSDVKQKEKLSDVKAAFYKGASKMMLTTKPEREQMEQDFGYRVPKEMPVWPELLQRYEQRLQQRGDAKAAPPVKGVPRNDAIKRMLGGS